MGLCTESDDCPVLESTERVKTGHAKKFSSKFLSFYTSWFCRYLYVWLHLQSACSGATGARWSWRCTRTACWRGWGRAGRCWAGPSWSARQTSSLPVSTPAASPTGPTCPRDTPQVDSCSSGALSESLTSHQLIIDIHLRQVRWWLWARGPATRCTGWWWTRSRRWGHVSRCVVTMLIVTLPWCRCRTGWRPCPAWSRPCCLNSNSSSNNNNYCRLDHSQLCNFYTNKIVDIQYR